LISRRAHAAPDGSPNHIIDTLLPVRPGAA
jgi:hypothetical protein